MTDEAQKIECGQRLVSLRGSTSQAEFAKMLGCNKNTLAHYERGERWPSLETLIRLKELTGADLNWLATGKGSTPQAHDVDPTLIQATEIPSADNRFDPAAIKHVAGVVSLYLSQNKIDISTSRFIELVFILFQMSPENVDSDTLMQLLETNQST